MITKPQMRKIINKVSDKINKDISGHANRGGMYSGSLASEGYNGGYRDALQDILLLMSDVIPNRNYWWSEIERKIK